MGLKGSKAILVVLFESESRNHSGLPSDIRKCRVGAVERDLFKFVDCKH